jgi:hypothetical protein
MPKIILNRKFLFCSVIVLLISILFILEYKLYLADNAEKHFIKPNSGGYKYLNPMKLNDFEFKLANSNMYWVQKYFTENSWGSVIHNTANPLYGTADVRFDFTYRQTNEPKAWDAWGSFQLEFEQPADFSNLKEIRIALRSDKKRILRIYLGNPDVRKKYGVIDDYGWHIEVTEQTQTVALKISEIAFPPWGVNNPDIKAEVLESARNLIFGPMADYSSDGFMNIVPDTGYLQVDNIKFVY